MGRATWKVQDFFKKPETCSLRHFKNCGRKKSWFGCNCLVIYFINEYNITMDWNWILVPREANNLRTLSEAREAGLPHIIRVFDNGSEVDNTHLE